MERADIAVIGAGVIGLSIAYHLALRDNSRRIIVIEREKFPGMGSTAQCTGGIRYQFSSRANIMLTKISMPCFLRFPAEMGYPIYFRQRGYLFLSARRESISVFGRNLSLLSEMDIPAEHVRPNQLAARYPFLKTDDLVGGAFCALDGYADPYGVCQGYLQQARRLGVKFYCEEEVTGVDLSGDEITGLTTTRRKVRCPVVVNAAGPHLPYIGGTGLVIPAGPYRRQVYVCSPVEGIPGSIPLVVDMDSGFYVHAEKNGTLLLGGTDRDSSPGLNTDVNWSLLDGFIEAATARIPTLAEGRLVRAYVGIRSLTPDYHGIMGQAPGIRGYYLAGGFAGNGFMHSPAIGQIMALLILDGECPLMDISPFSPDRFGKSNSREDNIF